MECPNCGHENRDVARFCQHCGAPLAEQQAAPGLGEHVPAEDEQVTEMGEVAVEALTAVAPPADTGQPAVSVEVPEQEAAQGLEPGAGEGRTEAAEGPEGEEGAEPTVPQIGGPAVPSAATPVDQEGGPPLPDESWAELPVQDADIPGGQPEEAGAGPEGMVGMVSGEEPLAGAEGTGARDQAEVQGRESIPGDQGTVEVEEEMLDEAETQEQLVPLEPAEGEPALQPEEVRSTEAELRSADLLPWRDAPVSADVLEPGAVIDGRYRVVEVLAIDEDDVLYSARDLQRCPQCGFDENSPDQAFCTACGAVMDQKPLVNVLQQPAERAGSPDVELLGRVDEQGRVYWVWQEPGKQTDVLGGSEEPMRMTIGQRSHPGQARELDEDSLFTLTISHTYESAEQASGLFIVADGMGGHEAGELASRIAIRTLAGVVLRDVFARELAGDQIDEDLILGTLERAMQAANEQVFLERERRENDMGTTVTAVLLRQWTLYLAHVGDCRAYRWGEDGLQQLTTDHSVIASMVASGAALPEEVYTHPHRSVIYRCVGDQPQVTVDTAVLSIELGDRVVLCCDGLWEMLREDGIEEALLREADPQRACDALVDAANEAGGPDNISVIVVQV